MAEFIGYPAPINYISGLEISSTWFSISYGGNIYIPISTAVPFTTESTFDENKWTEIQGVTANDLGSSDGAALVGSTDGETMQNIINGIRLKSIEELRGYSGFPNGHAAIVAAYYSGKNIGGGIFIWDALSNESDDGGTIIQVSGVDSGRWRRVLQNGNIYAEYFGCLPYENETDISNRYDNVANFALAAAKAFSEKKPVQFGSGNYYFSGPIDPGFGIVGQGCSLTIFSYPKGTYFIYGVGDKTTWRDSCDLKDFAIQGPLKDNLYASSEMPSIENSLRIAYYKNANIERVNVFYSRNVSINAMWCGVVHINDCYICYGARDGIHLEGCTYVRITNIVGMHLDDDMIAVHTVPVATGATSDSEFFPDIPYAERSVHISGIYGIDTKGIRVHGAINTSISDFVMIRPKEYGLILGGYSDSEGWNDSLNVTASNGSIYNVIPGSVVKSAGGNNSAAVNYFGIGIGGRGARATVDGYYPGQFDSNTKMWLIPEEYNYVSAIRSTTTPRAGSQHFKINNVNCRTTLPALTNYSEWGVGEVWTGAGWVDPVISTLNRSIEIFKFRNSGLHIKGLTIENCEFYNFSRLLATGSYVQHLGDFRVKNNKFIRFKEDIINFNTYDSSLSRDVGNPYGIIEFSGNYIDADPYVEHSNRTSDGGWSDLTAQPFAIVTDGESKSVQMNLLIERNIFRNICMPMSNPGAITRQTIDIYRDNIYMCQPDNTGTESSSGNLGIRDVFSAASSKFIYEVCDPTAANYGKTLYCQGIMQSSLIPTYGWYYIGQYVSNSLPAITNGKVLLGWVRLTTGVSHLSGIDWSPVYASTN